MHLTRIRLLDWHSAPVDSWADQDHTPNHSSYVLAANDTRAWSSATGAIPQQVEIPIMLVPDPDPGVSWQQYVALPSQEINYVQVQEKYLIANHTRQFGGSRTACFPCFALRVFMYAG